MTHPYMWDNPFVMLLEPVSWLVHMCYETQQRGANERRAGSAAGTYSLLRAWLWAIQPWHSHAHSHCRSASGSRYWGGAPSWYKHTHTYTHTHTHTRILAHMHTYELYEDNKTFREDKRDLYEDKRIRCGMKRDLYEDFKDSIKG